MKFNSLHSSVLLQRQTAWLESQQFSNCFHLKSQICNGEREREKKQNWRKRRKKRREGGEMELKETYPLLLNILMINGPWNHSQATRRSGFQRVYCLKDRWKVWVVVGLREIRELKASPSGNKQKEIQLGLHSWTPHPWIQPNHGSKIWGEKISANSKRSKTWICHIADNY